MEGKWIRWEPMQGLSEKYYIDAIVDDLDNFRIKLSDINDRNNIIEVVFESSVDAYRSTDESYRLKVMRELSKKHGAEFYGRWTFFKVENSNYLKWLSEQSFEITNSLNLIHFVLVGEDSILDIITTYEPEIIYTT